MALYGCQGVNFDCFGFSWFKEVQERQGLLSWPCGRSVSCGRNREAKNYLPAWLVDTGRMGGVREYIPT